jgi:predicted RNase H-like HicB family nuclease
VSVLPLVSKAGRFAYTSLIDACAKGVQTLEKASGLAHRLSRRDRLRSRFLITHDDFVTLGKRLQTSAYGKYLVDVAKWIESGEQVTVTRNGAAFATLAPAKLWRRREADWATRAKRYKPVGRKLTKEETESFWSTLRDSIGIALGRSLAKLPVMKFVTTLDRDEDGIWIAECPAIPGCVSQGSTRDEALANIREAIALCLEVRAERGIPLTIETRQIEVTV